MSLARRSAPTRINRPQLTTALTYTCSRVQGRELITVAFRRLAQSDAVLKSGQNEVVLKSNQVTVLFVPKTVYKTLQVAVRPEL